MNHHQLTIIDNKQIARNIYKLELDSSDLFEDYLNIIPGQFLYIRVNNTNDPFLRRPISIYDFDEASKRVRLIYRIDGNGTKILKEKLPGEMLDILGPLGNGYSFKELKKDNQVVLIGGGIGIPPLYYLAKKLTNLGLKPAILLGYETKADSFLINEFSELGEVRIASIDGTIGIKGNVLNLINDGEKWNVFYSCGPLGMIRALRDKWIVTEINGFVSLEERMGCGVGACYGCIVKIDREIDTRGYKKVCSDGPVFSFREVLL